MDDPLKVISTTRVSDTSASRIIASMDAPTMGASTTDTTTTLSDSSTQAPTFFHLPLEIRYQIYNELLHSDGNKTVYMEVTLNTTSGLDPITRLISVSRQIRAEVHELTVSESTFHIKAGVFTDMTLKPYATALKMSRTYTVRSRSYKDGNVARVKDGGHDKEIPHQLKFWKLCIPVIGSSGKVQFIADVDFRKQSMTIRDIHTVSPKFGGGGTHDPLPFEEAFTKTMQTFSSKEGFDGVTFHETTLFLEQIVLPDQGNFWCEAGLFRTLRQLREEKMATDRDRAIDRGRPSDRYRMRIWPFSHHH